MLNSRGIIRNTWVRFLATLVKVWKPAAKNKLGAIYHAEQLPLRSSKFCVIFCDPTPVSLMRYAERPRQMFICAYGEEATGTKQLGLRVSLQQQAVWRMRSRLCLDVETIHGVWCNGTS